MQPARQSPQPIVYTTRHPSAVCWPSHHAGCPTASAWRSRTPASNGFSMPMRYAAMRSLVTSPDAGPPDGATEALGPPPDPPLEPPPLPADAPAEADGAGADALDEADPHPARTSARTTRPMMTMRDDA